MKITVQDFTGIYDYQPFMQELRQKAANSTDVHWLDCTKIIGTDCYCDDDAIKEINDLIDNAERSSGSIKASNSVSNSAGTVPIHFFDNGNYHYMSKLWTDRIQEPFSLIVFDHHPDMQPPRFGGILSCGGWVKEVLDNNKFIQNVVIIGVKDSLVETVREELSQSDEAKILDKVTFITESKILKEIPDQVGSGNVLSSFIGSEPANVLSSNVYFSIDKDTLSTAFAVTNWDQGSLSTEALKATIARFAAGRKILGIDICGERSHDFEGNEQHSVQDADALNNSLNRELFDFLQKL
jgi:hypothetical protein